MTKKGRGDMKPSYINRVMPITVVSRIVEREAVSLQPTLLVQADMSMRKPTLYKPCIR